MDVINSMILNQEKNSLRSGDINELIRVLHTQHTPQSAERRAKELLMEQYLRGIPNSPETDKSRFLRLNDTILRLVR